MRIFRLIISLLFVVVFAVFSVVFLSEKIKEDKTIPVITIENEIIDVSLKAKDEELLQGVTAYDEKDKDLTDKVIVESISRFIEKGVCKVTYSVCDSNNNVAKATRKIRYKDYVSPTFKVNESLCYSMYESIDLSEAISAKDSIDGDITSNLIVTSKDYASAVAGVFTLDVTVTNKNGDSSEISLPLVVEDRSIDAPVIELKDYLVYAKTGSQLDLASYVVSATDKSENDVKGSVRIESNLDLNKEGTYIVHYYATDANSNRGHSIMTVVVGK